MTDVAVKANTRAPLGRVDGELRAGRNATIEAESGGRVVVTEGAYFEGPVTIDCDFECASIRVEGKGFGPGGDVVIRGDLVVHGSADMDASVRVTGTAKAEAMDVGGHLRVGGITTGRLRVGGHLECKGKLEAGDVDSGGHFTVYDEIKVNSLRVGGHAEFKGGAIGGELKVRGHLKTEEPLTYGQIQVFGSIRLPAGSSGQHLSAIGKAEFEGDMRCKEIDVAGTVIVNGNCSSETVKAMGKLSVAGSLTASQDLDVLGVVEVKQNLECESLSVGGKLVADSVVAHARADVGGHVMAAKGLKARTVNVGKGSRVNGPTIGDLVEVGKEIPPMTVEGQHPVSFTWPGRMTRVDDVYGKTVRMGPYSQANRVFAETVEIENGAVAAEITYTSGMRLPKNYHLQKPPRRADHLPEPPL